MSAAPRPWRSDIEMAGAASLNAADGTRIGTVWADIAPELLRLVNAFAALLAVAKAARGVDPGVACEEECDHDECDLTRAMAALDAAHPGWREWAP